MLPRGPRRRGDATSPSALGRGGQSVSGAPSLRAYQQHAIAGVEAAFAAGFRSPLIPLPTGGGKTVIAGEIIKREAERGNRVLFLAPRRELVHQASRKLADVGLNHGIILAGDPRHNIYSQIQVGSVDTVRARSKKLTTLDPHLIVIDEAHLYVTDIRKKLLDQWPSARRIGLSATPCRKDGRGLNVLFDKLVDVASVADLTEQGHLVPARYFSIAEPDLSRVKTQAGDYKLDELATAMSPLVADIPDTWLRRGGGRRTAVFAVNVAHSVALKAAFIAAGVAAEHVDGNTPIAEREAIFGRFSSGKTQVLCNVMVASIGFDLPALNCIVLARPTKSLATYLQMIGRGLRPAPGKTDCLVLDHSGCVHRLGFAADERFWTLDGHADLATSKRAREKSSGKEVTCPECRFVYAGGRTCPACQHYIAPKGKEIKTLDGELIEVGAHLPADRVERAVFYLELKGYATQHGFKPGWAAYKYQDKHGEMPPWGWRDLPDAEPSIETMRWVQSRFIARARERAVA
jgi:DNA repair protein RadD